MKIRVNVEAFHSLLLSNLESIAWEVDGPNSTGLILKPVWDDVRPSIGGMEGLAKAIEEDDGMDFEYEPLGKFQLPCGAPELALKMARHAMTIPVDGGKPLKELDAFPLSTFCLYEFLEASFPRNWRTSRIRGTIGANSPDMLDVSAEGYDSVLGEKFSSEAVDHCRFAGLGVIVMRESRAILGELLTENDLCLQADKAELILALY